MITAAIALLAAFGEITGKIEAFVKEKFPYADVPSLPIWVLVTSLLALSTYLIISGWRLRSRLLKPSALHLRDDVAEHLEGRGDDIERLTDDCRRYRLVFLEGESGVGKSALLQAGVVKAVARDYHPIYLSTWGDDWMQGPIKTLRDHLWNSLSADQKQALNLTAPPHPAESVFQVLKEFRNRLACTPLLLFDQFDDYQTQHRSHFVVEQRLVAPEILVANNPSQAELLAIASVEGQHPHRFEEALVRALELLEQRDLLRRLIDPESFQPAWKLQHDYLCRGVVEVHRRANAWFHLLQSSTKLFSDASHSAWGRWKGLLTPWQQIRLFFHRLRSQFRYGQYRAYALLSLVRFVPWTVVFIGAAWVGIAYVNWRQEQQYRAQAVQILARLDPSEMIPTPEELKALWELSQSPYGVRRALFAQSVERQPKLFNHRAQWIIQALVGLDRELGRKIFDEVCRSLLTLPPGQGDVARACVITGLTLEVENQGLIATRIVDVMKETTNPWQLRVLAWGLGRLGAKAGQPLLQQAATRIVTVMEKTTDPRQLKNLAVALRLVASGVSEETLIHLLKRMFPSAQH